MGDESGPIEPDSRDRARLLRTVAHQFRQVDTARMTGAQGYQLVEALRAAADGAPMPVRPENVHELPLRPGPDSSSRRANLALDAAADRAERAADEMDRRLDEAGVPPGSSDLLTLDELLAVAGESSADRGAGSEPSARRLRSRKSKACPTNPLAILASPTSAACWPRSKPSRPRSRRRSWAGGSAGCRPPWSPRESARSTT